MSGELHVTKLSKSYRQWDSEWRRVASWFIPSITPREEHWVLKDVSFSIGAGEAVGIIGQNGAGKTTLLKLITGTTRPTQGEVHVSGRVAAILELGMGFNPELTGRQNVYHSAGLMGHSQAEINRALPEIEAFAEIGEYFDQPMRTYSSGMQMRVAFSVATAFKPDLLIVDEALSVGDAYFQAKCYERIAAYKERGTTLLLVTHSVGDIVKHCNRALLLRAGRLVLDGNPRDVSNLYLEELFGKSKKEAAGESDAPDPTTEKFTPGIEDIFHTRPGYRKEEHRWGNGKAQILDYLVRSNGRDYPPTIESNALTQFYFKVLFNADFDDITAGFLIKTYDGVFLYGTNSFLSAGGKQTISAKKGEVVVFKFTLTMALNAGHYLASFGIASGPQEMLEPLDRRYDSVLLTVERYMGFWGLVDLGAKFGMSVDAGHVQ
jgi:lipopolysaccharide transport system ATP-binding protein